MVIAVNKKPIKVPEICINVELSSSNSSLKFIFLEIYNNNQNYRKIIRNKNRSGEKYEHSRNL